jgi:hypothetical protein
MLDSEKRQLQRPAERACWHAKVRRTAGRAGWSLRARSRRWPPATRCRWPNGRGPATRRFRPNWPAWRSQQKSRELTQRNRYPRPDGRPVTPITDGHAHHVLGRDGGDEHPAAAGIPPRAGARGRGHGRRGTFARRSAVSSSCWVTSPSTWPAWRPRVAPRHCWRPNSCRNPSSACNPRWPPTRTARPSFRCCSKRSGRSARPGKRSSRSQVEAQMRLADIERILGEDL